MDYRIELDLSVPKSWLKDLESGGEWRFNADRGQFSFDVKVKTIDEDEPAGIGRAVVIPLRRMR